MERLWVSPFDTLTRLCEIIQQRLDLTSTRVELANELLPLFFLGFRKGFTQASSCYSTRSIVRFALYSFGLLDR